MKIRIEPSLISSAGLVGTDLSVNIKISEEREGGSRLGRLQRTSTRRERGKARCSRVSASREKQGGCGDEGAASSTGESQRGSGAQSEEQGKAGSGEAGSKKIRSC